MSDLVPETLRNKGWTQIQAPQTKQVQFSYLLVMAKLIGQRQARIKQTKTTGAKVKPQNTGKGESEAKNHQKLRKQAGRN